MTSKSEIQDLITKCESCRVQAYRENASETEIEIISLEEALRQHTHEHRVRPIEDILDEHEGSRVVRTANMVSNHADIMSDWRKILDEWWGGYDASTTDDELKEPINEFCDGFALRDNGFYPVKHDTEACKAGYEYRIASDKNELPYNPHAE